jgi:hypothetical protein
MEEIAESAGLGFHIGGGKLTCEKCMTPKESEGFTTIDIFQEVEMEEGVLYFCDRCHRRVYGSAPLISMKEGDQDG